MRMSEEPELPPLTPLSETPPPDGQPKGYAADVILGLKTALIINRLKQSLILQRLSYGNDVLRQLEQSHRILRKIRPEEKIPTITELLTGSEEQVERFRRRERERERRGWFGRFIRRIKQAL